jgi:N-acetylneuraminate synthase
MLELKERYHVPVGLSDHSEGIYTALAAVALGADVVEKHFTSDKSWEGSDISISIVPEELRELVRGAGAIKQALGRTRPDDSRTADFAFACVVSIRDIYPGDTFTEANVWVKRPGTGMIKAAQFEYVLGKTAACCIAKDTQLEWCDIC